MNHNPHIIAHAALIISILQLQLLTPTLYAAVPMHWTVDVSRVQPEVRDVVRGETIALEATLKNDGKPFAMGPEPVCIFWQTNGMGRLWWSAPAQVLQSPTPTPNSNSISNLLAATFTPAMDPGAATVNGFLGSTGDIYRAAFQLRFRHGPGAVPNELPLPTPTIDFAKVTVLNPPWSGFDTNAVIDIATSVVAPAVNAAVNTGRAITAAAAASATNYTDTVASLKADKTNTYTMAAADGTFVARRDVEQVLFSSIYPVSGSGVLSHLQANYTKSADIARDYLLKSDATAYAEKAALATATNALDAAKRGKTDLDVYGPAWDFSPFVAKMPTFPADGVYVYPCAFEPRQWFWAVLPNGATTLEAVIAFDSRAGGYSSLADALAHDITSFKADRLREGSQWETIRNVTIHKTAIGPTGDRISTLADIPAEVEVIDPASATSIGKAADALKTKESLAAKADSADYENVKAKAENAVQISGGTMTGELHIDGVSGNHRVLRIGEFYSSPGALYLTPYGFAYGRTSSTQPSGETDVDMTWEEIATINGLAPTYDDDTISPTFYTVGDIVSHNGTIYQCISATSGAWNPTKWAARNLRTLFNAEIDAENPRFSNAVLSVGLNISTNDVAAIGQMVDIIHDFPIDPTTGATSIGALLAALAAAVALLRKRTQLLKSDGTAEDDFAANLLGKQVAINFAHYAKVDISAVEGTHTLLDRTINRIAVSGNITIAMPSVPQGMTGSRDFALYLKASAASAQITLDTTANTYLGDDMPTTAVGGRYIVTFTELDAEDGKAVWLRRVADITPKASA